MKKFAMLFTLLLLVQATWAQVKGNYIPQNNNLRQNQIVGGNAQYQNLIQIPDQNISIGTPNISDIHLSVKGMTNVTADAYVAIFSVIQFGQNAEEVNRLIDERINAVKNTVQGKPGVTFTVDMIAFLPLYEFEEEKKAFSKTTYNEIPKGFKLKKNLHIKYTDPNTLTDLISACAKSEIYDLAKVEYISSKMEQVKKELRNKAKTLLKEKIQFQQDLIGVNFSTADKGLTEGYKVVYPIEMYTSYTAYSRSSLSKKAGSIVNTADKNTTLFYQPIVDKEFDFVTNPTIVDPVIQVMYELRMVMRRPAKKVEEPQVKVETKVEKVYHILLPDGTVKVLGTMN